MANRDFPHQSTADQWFSESQFESYEIDRVRSLGVDSPDRSSLLWRAVRRDQ
jgi:hypothetical protein